MANQMLATMKSPREEFPVEKFQKCASSAYDNLGLIAPGSNFSTKVRLILELILKVRQYKHHVYNDSAAVLERLKTLMIRKRQTKEETQLLLRFFHAFSHDQIKTLSMKITFHPKTYVSPVALPSSLDEVALTTSPDPMDSDKTLEIVETDSNDDADYQLEFDIKRCKKPSFYHRQKSRAYKDVTIGSGILNTMFFDPDPLDPKNLEFRPRYFVSYEEIDEETEEPKMVFEGFRNFAENNEQVDGMSGGIDELKTMKDRFKVFSFDDIQSKFAPYLRKNCNKEKYEKLKELYKDMATTDLRMFKANAVKFSTGVKHTWNEKKFKTSNEESVEWYQDNILGGKRWMTMGTDFTTDEPLPTRLEEYEEAAEPPKKKKKTLPRKK